jgi:hypothetical protein
MPASRLFFDGGLPVWIGDTLNGLKASARVAMDDLAWSAEGSIARWLQEAELALYPDSHYGKAHRTIADLTQGKPNVGRMVWSVSAPGITLEEAEALAIDSARTRVAAGTRYIPCCCRVTGRRHGRRPLAWRAHLPGSREVQ